MTANGFDAIVLAGGLARRLDGTDKPALEIGGVTLLDRVLAACADAHDVVCVGPERKTARPVHWTRENPPGVGPVAALAAGLEDTLARSVAPEPFELVLAADLPFLSRELVHSLWISAQEHEGALLVDDEGRDQWLAACYAREALLRRLDEAREEYGSLAGLPLKRVLGRMDLVRVPDPEGRFFDCDTWEDVDHVRRLVGGGGRDGRPSGTESER